MLDSVYFQLTIELFFGFIALLISMKIIGKRQIQQVSPFDFISAIVMGEFLGNAIYDSEISVFHIIYAIAVWTVLLYAIEKAVQKSRKLRRVVEGSPVLLIKNGVIDYQVMKKEKLDFVELLSVLRDKSAYSIREIEYAILEHNGIVSVIKKSQYDVVTRNDLHIEAKPAQLDLPLIIEGEIIKPNLMKTDHDESWLSNAMMQEFDVNDIKDILYAEWNANDGFHVQKWQAK